jgi:hypothetical protein
VTDQRDDKEFEAFLAGESELTDRYVELGREEPPPELDAYILAKARNAAKIHQAEFGPRGGWLKPVALAATVLLSFSVVMKTGVDTPTRFEQVSSTSMQKPARLNAEILVKEAGAPEAQRKMENLLISNGLEEITVTLRKQSVESKDVSLGVSAVRSEVSLTDRDAALSIVAEYVAAADSDRIEADAIESRFLPEEEQSRTAMPGSIAAEKFMSSVNEPEADDDLWMDPELMLQEIERLNTGSSSAEAAMLLDEFLARYPDHPVSVNIRQQGY